MEAGKSITIEKYDGNNFLKLYSENIENNKKINQFKYFESGSDFHEYNNVNFFVLYSNNEMVGLAHIRKSPYIDKTFWLSYLSILPEFENMGCASKLSDFIIR